MSSEKEKDGKNMEFDHNSMSPKKKEEARKKRLSFLTAFSVMCEYHSSVSETRVQIKRAAVHVRFLIVSAYGIITQTTAAWALARLGPILLQFTFGAKKTARACACWEEIVIVEGCVPSSKREREENLIRNRNDWVVKIQMDKALFLRTT